MAKPESKFPPDIYYNEEESQKYAQSSRINEIQTQMSERAIELLLLPDDTPCYLLDIGCGTGISGGVLEEQGHVWVGMDIAQHMLDKAVDMEQEGDLLLADIGDGCPFRAGSFDGAISISVLQWLCNAYTKSQNPVQRLGKFFQTLYACLSRSARAVFQFYPENSAQMELITAQAMKAGFYGGVVVDYPNSTKAKKFFLCLMTGGNMPLPKPLGTNENEQGVAYTSKREQMKQARGKPLKKSRQWILEKKERRRRQGKETRPDSKYTGRKRSGRF